MIGDDAPHDCQPEPRPGPDILGRVERLEDVDLCRTRYPRSVVGDLDDHTRAFHVRPDGDASASVHSVYGVVDQVGPYLVQLAAVPRYPGQVFLVLSDQRDVLQPRLEDGEGVLQAGDHIDLSHNRPVHVSVLFHRPDQMGDASYASLDLTGQADEVSSNASAIASRRSLSTPASANAGAISHGSSQPWSPNQSVSSSSASQRESGSRTSALPAAVSRCRATSASRSGAEKRSSCPKAVSWASRIAPPNSSEARLAAAAGLFSS